MDGKYRGSFFNTETGGQMTRRMFIDAGDDFTRATVFKYHSSHWKPIRDRVEKWVVRGWDEWEDERPEWFTDLWVSKVPKDMIPKKRRRVSTTSREHQDAGANVLKKIAEKPQSQPQPQQGAAVRSGSSRALVVSGRRKNSFREVIGFGGGGGGDARKIVPEGTSKADKGEDFDANKFMQGIKRKASLKF